MIIQRWMQGSLSVGCGLLVAGLGAFAADTVSLFPDAVVAKGKGFEIRRSQLDDAVAALRATLAAQGQPIPDNQRQEVEAKLLDRLIFAKVMLQKATPADKTKAKEAADKFVADEKSKSPSEAAFKRRLLALGMTPDQFAARALEDKTVETVVDRELKSTIVISAEQIKAFYERGIDAQVRDLQATADRLAKSASNTVFYADAKKKLEELTKGNLARLDRPERVRACHILFYTVDRITHEPLTEEVQKAKRAQMEKLLARLKAGEDFTKLAKEFSEDPEVQRTGGEYVITRETNMSPELKTAWLTLPVNQLSGLIDSQYGCHIAKVLERLPAGKVPLAEAERDLREYLLTKEVEQKLPAYFEQLRKEFAVE